MSKQTATDWLFRQLWDEPQDKFTWYALLQEAKKMEKEQNELTCINVIETILDKKEKNEIIDSKQIFEEYYNETYGGDK
jgi:hypothetical protein